MSRLGIQRYFGYEVSYIFLKYLFGKGFGDDDYIVFVRFKWVGVSVETHFVDVVALSCLVLSCSHVVRQLISESEH